MFEIALNKCTVLLSTSGLEENIPTIEALIWAQRAVPQQPEPRSSCEPAPPAGALWCCLIKEQEMKLSCCLRPSSLAEKTVVLEGGTTKKGSGGRIGLSAAPAPWPQNKINPG